MKTRENNRSGLILGYLSLGLGAFLLIRFIGGPLLDRLGMQNWEPVHADVLLTDLEARRGDGATTYRATGQYHYLYQGRIYTGSRLGHSQAADNIGNWHQNMYAYLANGHSQGSGIRIWINPKNPGESIVDRDPRTEYLLFLAVFASVPLLLGTGLIWWYTRARYSAPPGSRPWLANRNWKDNRIRSNITTQLWFYWGFALVWNLFNIPLLLKASEVLAESSPVATLVFLFPVVGAGLLLAALVKTRQWLRFGVAELTLEPFPGRAGGQVSGHIDIRLPWSSTTRAHLVLSCIHAYSERYGNKRRTRHVINGQDQTRVSLTPAQRGSRVNFRFAPPAGLPASGAAGPGRYYWTLDVNIPVPGADFVRQYEIPVFAAAGQMADSGGTLQDARTPEPVTATAAGAISAATEVSEELLEHVLKFGYSSRGRLFSFLPYRSLRLSLALTAMGMLFSGVGSFMYIKTNAPLPFLLVFIVSGLALFLYGIVSLGQRRDVTISSDRIRITNSYLGLERTTEVAVADITGISKRIGYQSSDGTGHRAAYSVYLNTRGGKSIKVGDSLPGSGMADYVISEMQKIMHLPATDLQTANPAAAGLQTTGPYWQRGTKLLINLIIAVVLLLVAWNFLAKFLGRW